LNLQYVIVTFKYIGVSRVLQAGNLRVNLWLWGPELRLW